MTGSAYPNSSLDANRAGRLGPDQMRSLQASVRYRSQGLVRHLLHANDAFARDVASGQVSAADGAFTKKVTQSNTGGVDSSAPPSYRVFVASREAGNQEFKCDQQFYDRAPDSGLVRLYYLPQSRFAVNFELLPDAPRPPGESFEQRGRQALRDFGAAIRSRDAVGKAEARADMAAIGRETKSYRPTPDQLSGPRQPPDQLRQAVIGDWTSPFLSVSIRADGTLSAATGGQPAQSGRWSMDSAGRVHTDVMGSPMVIDAAVAGDVLTLVINGQGLNLRRGRG
jgi:hypothetical protein